MLTTLIESKRTRSRSRGAAAVSVMTHAVLVTLVAAVTAHASDRTPAMQPEHRTVIYVDPAQRVRPEQHRAETPRTDAPSRPVLPTLPRTHVDVPRTIPTGIPPVDLSLPPIDPSQFSIGAATSSAASGVDGTASGDGTGALSVWQVDRAVAALPGNPKPAYPSMLQSGRVEGEVVAQFVVDTTGRVDMSTFRALQATNELFVSSVRRALAEWKFRPAEADGRRVEQLVEMPLVFRVR